MSFINWIRDLKERNSAKTRARRSLIQHHLDMTSAWLRSEGVAPDLWQCSMSSDDARALTGELYDLGEFFRWETPIGSLRVRIAFQGDIKPGHF